MEQTECSEMLTHKIQIPENHPKERKQHLEHGKIKNVDSYLQVDTVEYPRRLESSPTLL